MGLLALACLVLGVGAPLISPVIANVAAALGGQQSMEVAAGALVYPGEGAQTVLSTPLVAILLIGLLFLPLFIYALFERKRLRHRHGGDPGPVATAMKSRCRFLPVALHSLFAPCLRHSIAYANFSIRRLPWRRA